MTEWLRDIELLADNCESSVLVTVAGIRGSAPRETGARMIVTGKETIGSIGGGQLEYQSTARAVEMLAADEPQTDIRRYSLGANCGQCCGGVVEVLFEFLPRSRSNWLSLALEHFRERHDFVLATETAVPGNKFVVSDNDQGGSGPDSVTRHALEILSGNGVATIVDGWLLEPVTQNRFQIAVFGAGHVGAATVELLAKLECDIRWIDSRRQIFPQCVPNNVVALAAAEPAREVAAMPSGSYVLVMTHSHPLDLDICSQVLRRDDIAYCGLIGSESKRRRFERLLKKQGLGASELQRLTCPIGVPGIHSKKPLELALAVVAQLLQTRDEIATEGQRYPYLEVSG